MDRYEAVHVAADIDMCGAQKAIHMDMY
jgi:hypothetical protein